MTVIKATCPGCGEVDLGAEDISLTLHDDRTNGNDTYSFACPKCSSHVEKVADNCVVRLLMSGGVVPNIQVVPMEVFEREHVSGPPFTYDDLIDFHQFLETDDWEDALYER
jgi:predicted RNA-binding Zn-ribbon protein involved in translation (DUF1610 family)